MTAQSVLGVCSEHTLSSETTSVSVLPLKPTLFCRTYALRGPHKDHVDELWVNSRSPVNGAEGCGGTYHYTQLFGALSQEQSSALCLKK